MPKEELKVKARDSLKEFTSQTLKTDLANLPHTQRSWAMIRWYVDCIHNCLQAPISEDDLELSHVDNSGDLGVDFIYRNDGIVYIYQAKYLKRDTAVKLDEVIHFQSVLQRLHSEDFKKNSKLSDIVSEIKFDSDQFKLKFLCMGSFGKPDTQTHTQTLQSPILPTNVTDLSDRVEYEFLDEDRLTEELRQADSVGGDIPEKEVTIATCLKNGKRTPVIEFEPGGYRSCILVTEAEQILQIYKDRAFRDRLFSLNVRNYLGNVQKNKDIKNTAEENPEEFYHYNNGISCIAKSIDVQANRVAIKGLQVINGAQTIRTLLKASNSNKKTWAEKGTPILLVRIIEVPNSYATNGEFRNNIIKFNNTQNIIKVSDFRSNDPIQDDLKRQFGQITRYGRRVVYCPKRTDKKSSNSEMVPMEEFAKVVYSFLKSFVSFAGNSAYLFDEEQGYKYVFGNGSTIFREMPSEEFKLRGAIWWMSQQFENELKRDKQTSNDPDVKDALERKYPILFATRLVLEKSLGETYRSELGKCYEGNWKLGKEKEGKWFEAVYTLAKENVVFRYKEAKKNKKETFNHRNWTRSQKTVEDLEHYIKEAPIRTVGRISDYK